MTEAQTLLLAGTAGGALGTIFFGALWWTVRKGPWARRPALWFLGSALLRMSIALGGFYFVSSGHWDRLLACVLGFVIARLGVTWLTRPPGANHATPPRERSHGP